MLFKNTHLKKNFKKKQNKKEIKQKKVKETIIIKEMKNIIILFIILFTTIEAKRRVKDIMKELEEEEMEELQQQGGIIELSSQTFRKLIMEKEFTFIFFYDPTCKHCKQVVPKFQQLGKLVEMNKPNYRVARLDCDMYHSFCHKQKFLNGYPSLILFYDGYYFPEYKMSYSPIAMMDYIEYIMEDVKNEGLNDYSTKVEL